MAVVVVAAVVAATAWWLRPRAVPEPTAPSTAAPTLPADAESGPRYPLDAAPTDERAGPLPDLDGSDAGLTSELEALVGPAALRELFLTSGLARRFVATVDNLPRRQAPRTTWPVRGAPGSFVVAEGADGPLLAGGNESRYEPYIRVVTALDAAAAVAVYRRFYPLLQEAYVELGYPGRYFNDRLVVVIDDLLAAPEVETPIALVQPEVLFEFADPDLESRSAGQKLLIRIGPANARIVKSKLREIRALVVGG